jgi:aryl sulfotransferase
MQTIVASLLWPMGDVPGPVGVVSPWLEARFAPADEVIERLNAQEHRRFIKSHTPPDGIPWFPSTSYIAVFRDGRDAFMSLANHMASFRTEVVDTLNALSAEDHVEPMPHWDGDIHGFFRACLADEERLPPVHLAGWWERRHEPNLLLVHYNDLKADLSGEMERVAEFLGIDVPAELWSEVVDRCTFERMRERGSRGEIAPFERVFEGGSDSFIYKGTNGRWRDVFSVDELISYERLVADRLAPEAAAWLEHGSLTLGSRP